MTMTDTTNADYAGMVAVLNGRQHRKISHNTYARLEEDGRIVVKLHDTDILTFHPNGEVEYQSGGWLTITTKERMNRFGAASVTIYQERGRWYIVTNRDWENRSDYYEGIRVRDGQVTTGVKHSGDPDKKIKAAIDRYVKLYTDEKIAELVEIAQSGATSGDCWFCLMRVQGTGEPLGEAHGDHDHLREHLKDGYVMLSTIFNAVQAAGYRSPPVILTFSPDIARRALKRYLRQRLATNTAGAGVKPISQGF